MNTQVFDGQEYAQNKLVIIKERILDKNLNPKLASIVHKEDKIGQVYTRLKKDAANKVGIDFEKIEISFSDHLQKTNNTIEKVSKDKTVSGLLIQKPSRDTWKQFYSGQMNFYEWWQTLTQKISPKKDVDCLTRVNLDSIYSNQSNFLPATARAVVSILKEALNLATSDLDFGNHVISIVGKSELLGKPLAAYLSNYGAKVYLLGSKDKLADFLTRSDIIISATGVKHLITKDLVKNDAIVIDVGEPSPDVDFENVKEKTSFITPVPGGVGPVTVASLLENLLTL